MQGAHRQARGIHHLDRVSAAASRERRETLTRGHGDCGFSPASGATGKRAYWFVGDGAFWRFIPGAAKGLYFVRFYLFIGS